MTPEEQRQAQQRAAGMKRQDREGPVHLAVLRFLRLALPGALIHHSPNETSLKGRDVARMIAKQKHLGMLVGFPDLLCLHDGLFMAFEVKAEGNGATQAQKLVGQAIKEAGGQWAIVRSVDDVRECLTDWGVSDGR